MLLDYSRKSSSTNCNLILQVAELEAEFEKLPPGKAQQTRFLRSQQDLKVKMEEAAAAGEEEEEGIYFGLVTEFQYVFFFFPARWVV